MTNVETKGGQAPKLENGEWTPEEIAAIMAKGIRRIELSPEQVRQLEKSLEEGHRKLLLRLTEIREQYPVGGEVMQDVIGV